MKITVLVENTTTSSTYKPKHGLCLYIETINHKILFDLGSNKMFLENAKLLGIDILAVDTVIISHGHSDHGGALKLFLEVNKTAKIYIQERAFDKHYIKVYGIPFYVGIDKSLKDNNRIIFTKKQFIINDELLLFSGVTERQFYATSNDVLLVKKERKYMLDNFEHEQNLIITENNNIVLLAGCAHNGIVNIKNAAEEILDKKLSHVVSGFHLYNPVTNKLENKILISNIADILNKDNTRYFTCHCTGQKAFTLLENVMNEKIKYISTGQKFTI